MDNLLHPTVYTLHPGEGCLLEGWGVHPHPEERRLQQAGEDLPRGGQVRLLQPLPVQLGAGAGHLLPGGQPQGVQQDPRHQAPLPRLQVPL